MPPHVLPWDEHGGKVDREYAHPTPQADQDKPKRRTKYIRWSDLLRRVFGIETVCQTRHVPLRLISLIKSDRIAKKILTAMHLPAQCPSFTRLARRRDATGTGGTRKTV